MDPIKFDPTKFICSIAVFLGIGLIITITLAGIASLYSTFGFWGIWAMSSFGIFVLGLYYARE